ncbi:isochorismatase family protein [Paenibacillus spongiae]|uniref:Isochorismatase family protein n=1 Tax=Paenibacillus spongiae TaxID=2909671 RepID=A0ABY5SH96_9BACL|nr:isochorismatase family protein [Paenibacillus spongiae]UVI33139.1 isochorismatase family protein [Paenibacillus spongiae]
MSQSHKFFDRASIDNAAILLIDHQIGLISTLGESMNRAAVKNNTLALAKLAKAYNIPVILTTSNADGPNGPLMQDLVDMFPDVQVIDRVLINAWDDENFVNAVKKTGRTTLIMAGISTDVCLTFPAIAATADGYDVYGVLDASGTWNALIEQAAMLRMSQAGVKLTTWVSLSAELQRDWSLPTGQALAQTYAEHFHEYSVLMDLHNSK